MEIIRPAELPGFLSPRVAEKGSVWELPEGERSHNRLAFYCRLVNSSARSKKDLCIKAFSYGGFGEALWADKQSPRIPQGEGRLSVLKFATAVCSVPEWWSPDWAEARSYGLNQQRMTPGRFLYAYRINAAEVPGTESYYRVFSRGDHLEVTKIPEEDIMEVLAAARSQLLIEDAVKVMRGLSPPEQRRALMELGLI